MLEIKQNNSKENLNSTILNLAFSHGYPCKRNLSSPNFISRTLFACLCNPIHSTLGNFPHLAAITLTDRGSKWSIFQSFASNISIDAGHSLRFVVFHWPGWVDALRAIPLQCIHHTSRHYETKVDLLQPFIPTLEDCVEELAISKYSIQVCANCMSTRRRNSQDPFYCSNGWLSTLAFV